MKRTILVWLAVVLAAGTAPAWAQESPDTKGVKEAPAVVDTMVVTAGRVEEKKGDVSTNITVLNEEMIRISGAQDLGELLSQQGFMLREYPNSLVSVNIRGFRTETHGNDLASHVLILINGRRAGTGNLAKILVDNVERVEIVRGPGSVQYGASAMGGVVNVITKTGSQKPSFSVDGTLGSWEYHKASVEGSGDINGFDFSVNASTESQDDYETADGDDYPNTGFDEKNRVSINAGATFLPGHRVGVTYTGIEGKGIGSPGRLAEVDLDDYVDHATRSVDLVYDGKSAGEAFLWNLRYFNGKDEYETYDPETYGDTADYFRDTDQQGVQAQLTANWRILRATAGFDWTEYAIVNSYSNNGEESVFSNPAFFLLGKANFLDDRLILSLGGRHDSYEVESDDGRSTDADNWSSNAGAVFKITSGISVRVNYAEAFRMPTADELYMLDDYSAWGFGVWSGNENLDPEESKTYEAGLDFAMGAVSAGLTVFTTDFKNRISYAYNAATNITRYENVEGAKITGYEGSMQMDLAALFGWPIELTPYVSFTYLTEYEDEETGENIEYTPEWSASYGLRMAYRPIGLSAALNFSSTGEQDITDYAGTGETSLDSYTVADLTVSGTVYTFQKYGFLSLHGAIRNLFDEDYATVQGYPMPGRSFYAGVKYTY